MAIEKLEIELMSQQHTRMALCERSFKHFLLYYFSGSIKYPKLAPCHHDRISAINKGLNIYVEGHRELGKSTILGLALEARKICYRKSRFICNICYDKKKASGFNKSLANILMGNAKIINDFGPLFVQKKTKSDSVQETGVGEFVTTNGVKVKAFGMGEAIRGELFYTNDEGIIRPDHIFLDDIDNIRNTKNKTRISDDMDFIQGEIFGGMESGGQIVYLGNVIRIDGRNPRVKREYLGAAGWAVFSNFIYGKAGATDGYIAWSRYVETDKEAEAHNATLADPRERKTSLQEKRRTEKSGFEQNWLGIPTVSGQTIIELKDCRMIDEHAVPPLDMIRIGADPAFSEKTQADSFGLVVTGTKMLGQELHYYVLYGKELKAEEKRQTNVNKIFAQNYHLYKASRIICENNNGGGVFAKGIMAQGVAVDAVSATKDKLTRLKEYESAFQEGRVHFVTGKTENIIGQLIEFTGDDGGTDDLVDAMVRSFHGGTTRKGVRG